MRIAFDFIGFYAHNAHDNDERGPWIAGKYSNG